MSENTKSSVNSLKNGFRRGPGFSAVVEKPKSLKYAFARLLGYFKPYLKFLIGLFSCVTVTAVLSVIAPILLGNSIDYVVSSQWDKIPAILGIMLLIYILNSLTMFLQGLLNSSLSVRVVKKTS